MIQEISELVRTDDDLAANRRRFRVRADPSCFGIDAMKAAGDPILNGPRGKTVTAINAYRSNEDKCEWEVVILFRFLTPDNAVPGQLEVDNSIRDADLQTQLIEKDMP